MKILFLTSRLPFPPVGGDKLRTYNFINYLSKKHQLTLLSFIESEDELNCLSEYQSCCQRIIAIKQSKWNSYKKCLLGMATQEPLQIHYYASSRMRKTVQEELLQGYDVIFCHLIRMAQYLPNDMQIKKIVDFTDAISLNYRRSMQYRSGIFSLVNRIEAKRVHSYELQIINKSDSSIFISHIDADYLKNDVNHKKVKIIKNGVDFRSFPFYNGCYHQNQIVFIGNMRTFPNTDAVLYFVKDILPLLKKTIPDIRFYIVGTQPPKAVLDCHDGLNVFVTGYVNSVIPFLTESAVMIAPMRVGAGIQNKILEALAVGTPVVTSHIGAEGLDSQKLIIANDPKDISDRIVEVIKDSELRAKYAVEGRKYIEEKFNWDSVLTSLDKLIE